MSMKTTMNRLALKGKKYSPEIMLVAGLVGTIGATVWACVKSVKASDILKNHKTRVDKVKESHEEKSKEYKKELTKAYFKTGAEFAKNYAAPAALEGVSLGLMVGSHNILYGRNIALTAACTALQGHLKDVQAILPKEEIHKAVEKAMKDEPEEKKQETINKIEGSIYSRVFDWTSRNWTPGNVYYNLLFLRNQQNYFNELLRTRGHVFLNEVYDSLDVCLPGMQNAHSKAGAVVGWVLGSGGDDYIDFGVNFDIMDDYSIDNFPQIMGETGIALDFNVDGVIYDLI